MSSYTIRRVTKDDLDGLVDLHVAAYGMRDNAIGEVRTYHERLLEHVLCDARLGSPAPHSLVSVRDGELAAMVYSGHSPMLHHDKKVWATTGTLLAIHPDHRRVECTSQFIRAVLDAPDDLMIADRTNRAARHVVQGMASVELYPQYSLRWGRVVNPATGALGGALNRSQRVGHRVASALHRVTSAVDELVARSNPALTAIDAEKARQRLRTTTLRAEDLAQHGESLLSDLALRPDTTSVQQTELGWSRFRALRPEGRFERVAVWNRSDEMVGWYLLHTSSTGIAEVLQLVCQPRAQADVLALVLQHAQDLGVGSVHGTASPQMVIALSEAGAYYHGRGSAFMVASNRREVHESFSLSSALVSGLESEYPLMLAPSSALTESLQPL